MIERSIPFNRYTHTHTERERERERVEKNRGVFGRPSADTDLIDELPKKKERKREREEEREREEGGWKQKKTDRSIRLTDFDRVLSYAQLSADFRALRPLSDLSDVLMKKPASSIGLRRCLGFDDVAGCVFR